MNLVTAGSRGKERFVDLCAHAKTIPASPQAPLIPFFVISTCSTWFGAGVPAEANLAKSELDSCCGPVDDVRNFPVLCPVSNNHPLSTGECSAPSSLSFLGLQVLTGKW